MDYFPPAVVRLVADIKDFQAKMTAAQAEMNSLGAGASRSFGMVGVAAGIAGVAVAGLAAKMAVDGVKSALAEEQAVARLTTTLNNLKLGHSVGEIETFIDSLARATGVADDELRPAYDRLVRSTKDVNQANELLKLSMNVSAGTGRDLQSVVMALSRAHDGSTGSLGRLGAGIDQATLKTKNFDLITQKLADTFQGQAAAKAKTAQGAIDRLKVAVDEATEAFGVGLLGALEDSSGAAGDLASSVQDLEPLFGELGREVGNVIRDLGRLVRLGSAVMDMFNGTTDGADSSSRALNAFSYAMTTSPLTIFTEGLYKVAAGLGVVADNANTATGELLDFNGAAGGPSGSDISDAQDKWAQFYKVTPSAQEALAEARAKTGDLWDEWIEDQKDAVSGGAKKVAEEAKKAGLTIVDGLITGVSTGKLKISEAVKGQLDFLVKSYNDAVMAKREFATQVASDFMSMLDIGAIAEDFEAGRQRVKDAYDDLVSYQRKVGDDATDAERERMGELQTIYDEAVAAAEKTGADIVDAFVKESERIAKFGENMRKLSEAGLNEASWNQIMAMGAQKGAQLADALINGNMQQNISRVNDAVGSVKTMGQEIGKQSAETYKSVGIQNALGMLEEFIMTIAPKGKARKRLMDAMDELASAMSRVARITVVEERRTVGGGGGGGGGGGDAAWEQASAAAAAAMAAGTGLFDPNVSLPGLPSMAEWVAMGSPQFAEGGYVRGMGPQMAMVHGGEFVLSGDMLAGRQDVPREVLTALSRGGQAITVNAQTNADPYAIGRELAWALKVGA